MRDNEQSVCVESLDVLKMKLILHVGRQRTNYIQMCGYVSCIKTSPKGTGYEIKIYLSDKG
jgi:hypothetical protein